MLLSMCAQEQQLPNCYTDQECQSLKFTTVETKSAKVPVHKNSSAYKHFHYVTTFPQNINISDIFNKTRSTLALVEVPLGNFELGGRQEIK